MDYAPNQISADNHLNIQFSIDNWQLISTELTTPTTLITATPEGLITHPYFAEVRTLPSATLAPAQVARVVLGWAPETSAWRLGLLLIDSNATKMDTLSMQWCELAVWADPELMENTKHACQALARVINRPFQLIEPDGETRVPAFARMSSAPRSEFSLSNTVAEDVPQPSDELNEVLAEDYPVVPLMSLPLETLRWNLNLNADGVYWKRRSNWWLSYVGRILIYAVVAILFVLLGVGTQNNGFASVEPGWLPRIGLVIAGIIFLAILWTISQILRTSEVVVDTHKKEIYERSVLLPFVNWTVSFDKIDYVVLSQTQARPQGRRQRTDPMNIAQDVWLHIAQGDAFHEMVALGNVEGRSLMWDNVRRHHHNAIRRSVHLAEYDTPAHHAAFHIAERIGVPVYLDIIE